ATPPRSTCARCAGASCNIRPTSTRRRASASSVNSSATTASATTPLAASVTSPPSSPPPPQEPGSAPLLALAAEPVAPEHVEAADRRVAEEGLDRPLRRESVLDLRLDPVVTDRRV